MKTRIGSMIKVGAVVASLALVGAACGGDDGGGGGDGGVDRDAARAKLEAMIGEDGMPEEMVNCLVDAALDTFDDADLESVLDGGDPSQAAEDAFTEKAIECAG
ncbi:MAG: hypothetical protein RL547_607 [Actinomycetota bacterium]|jgi:hypothetical protein